MAKLEDAASSVLVQVTAESEGDQRYVWRSRLAMCQPVNELALMWAQAHGVPPSAVGFDDASNSELDLQQTPSSLGWRPGQEIVLKAFPTEDRFMEPDEEAGQREEPTAHSPVKEDSEPSGAAAGPEEPVQAKVEPTTRAAAKSADGETDGETAAAAAAVDTAGGSGEATEEEDDEVDAAAQAVDIAGGPGEATEEEDDEVDAAAQAFKTAAAQAPGAGGPARAEAPKLEQAAEAKRGGRGGGRGRSAASAAPAKAASRKGSKEEDTSRDRAAARGRGGGRRGAAEKAAPPPVDDGPPGEDEEILIDQANPKKQGSGAWERYEKYKKATTVKRMLELGACRGDVAHDFKRGFIKRKRR